MHIRDKNFKNAALFIPSHLMDAPIPAVKIPYHADTQRIRCPYGKERAHNAIHLHQVGTQLFIHGIMNSRIEFVDILIT